MPVTRSDARQHVANRGRCFDIDAAKSPSFDVTSECMRDVQSRYHDSLFHKSHVVCRHAANDFTGENRFIVANLARELGDWKTDVRMNHEIPTTND